MVWSVTAPIIVLATIELGYCHRTGLVAKVNSILNIDDIYLGYEGLSLMRDDFSGPFVQNVRNFRQS